MSRLGRYEEQKERKTIGIALGSIILVIIFFAVFGLKLLEGFSVFMGSLRGASPQPTTTATLLLPPVLDAPVEATNSAAITITGRGQADLTFILYVNEKEYKKIPVPKDGNVTIDNVTLTEGNNSISAKLSDDKGNLSDLSNVVTIIQKKGKPILDISTPEDGATVFGDKRSVTVSGKTDPENGIRVNDRLAVVRNDGSFDFVFTLSEGQNTLKIIATDTAGNETSVERKVTYTK